MATLPDSSRVKSYTHHCRLCPGFASNILGSLTHFYWTNDFRCISQLDLQGLPHKTSVFLLHFKNYWADQWSCLVHWINLYIMALKPYILAYVGFIIYGWQAVRENGSGLLTLRHVALLDLGKQLPYLGLPADTSHRKHLRETGYSKTDLFR